MSANCWSDASTPTPYRPAVRFRTIVGGIADAGLRTGGGDLVAVCPYIVDEADGIRRAGLAHLNTNGAEQLAFHFRPDCDAASLAILQVTP